MCTLSMKAVYHTQGFTYMKLIITTAKSAMLLLFLKLPLAQTSVTWAVLVLGAGWGGGGWGCPETGPLPTLCDLIILFYINFRPPPKKKKKSRQFPWHSVSFHAPPPPPNGMSGSTTEKRWCTRLYRYTLSCNRLRPSVGEKYR